MSTIFPPRSSSRPLRPNTIPQSHVDLPKPINAETYILNRNGQEQWAREMQNVAEITNRDVAVLLFSWDRDQTHSMNTTQELADLKDVFESEYGFKVETKLLSTLKPQKPRYQLASMLNDFLSEYDKPGTLLIIYYGGHGMLSDNKEELRLLGGNPNEDALSSTELNWNDVEPCLYRLNADLLLIFDCCYAGFVARDKRTWPASKSHFEFIGSTAFNKTARGPKSAGSFTRAMIESLHDLSTEEEFTTDALVRRIERWHAFRRTQQQPFQSTCGKSNSICGLKIRPNRQGSQTETANGNSSSRTINFYLHLKYVFKEKPSKEHIQAIAERLNDMIRNDRLPVSNVLWEGVSEYNPRMTMQDAAWMLSTRLGRRVRRRTCGQLEISASTDNPVLQRTMTNLNQDEEAGTSKMACEIAPNGNAGKESEAVSPRSFLTRPFDWVCNLNRRRICLIMLAMSSVFILSSKWQFPRASLPAMSWW